MGRRERRLEARKLLDEQETKSEKRKGSSNRYLTFFDKNLYKLQFIPILVLLLCISYNIYFIAENGDFVRKGVSLAGGTSVTVSTSDPIDQSAVAQYLGDAFPEADVTVRVLRSGGEQTGFTVDAANVGGDAASTESLLVGALREIYPAASFSVETTGPSLGAAFFRQTLYAILAAFVLMAIVVFISFRTIYPSLAVVLAGASTVISTLAVFNMLGMQLSTAGVAAFLMLIGYSIDTDILLSTRVLRRGGEYVDNVWSAMKTGLTMQVTTTIAVSVVLIFSNNPIFSQIMTIILIGMFFDVLYTWLQNTAILKWYVESRK
jgi:preprotein translocase subunit SecF